MTLALTGYKFYPVHLPYKRSVRWAGHDETGLDVMILALETAGGLIGIGEAPVRLNWTAATLKSIKVVAEEVFLDRMMGMDLSDEENVTRFLRFVREHALAKSMIDSAVWDLRAQAAGKPLWDYLGSPADVAVAWTITRADPAAMAAEAEEMVSRYGFTSLKIKTGQGIETDRAALAVIRNAVGPNVSFSADANRYYGADDVRTYTDMIVEYGVSISEDPCELFPDATFARARENSSLPILVDNTCRTLNEGKMFLSQGAEALSVKVPKTGIADSREIVRLADKTSAAIHIGLGGASSLGSVAALSLAGALVPHPNGLPCEESFFLQLSGEYVKEPLTVRDGLVRLPDVMALTEWVDWDRLPALAP